MNMSMNKVRFLEKPNFCDSDAYALCKGNGICSFLRKS